MDKVKNASIVAAIGQLDPEKDFTQGGVPSVEALEALLETSVSAQERDAAWEAFQAKQDAPEQGFSKSQDDDSQEPDPSPKKGSSVVTCADLLDGLRKKGVRI